MQRVLPWATLSIALLLTVFIPSNQSLWIDEAQTAYYASEPTFAGVMHKLVAAEDYASDAQMPFGVLGAWVGARILGTGEWQLRAPNIAWAMAAVIGIWLTSRRIGLPGLELVFALHPFVWLYVNEARPYAMQLAAASWLLFAVVDLIYRRGPGRAWIAAWSVSVVVLGGSSMLGLVMVAAASLVMLIVLKKFSWPIPRWSLLPISTAVTILMALSGYYLWTLSRGIGGAKLWVPGLANIGFAMYEFAGFAGLGPGRQELREFGRTQEVRALVTLMKPYAFQLFTLLVASAVVLVVWARQVRRSPVPMILGAVTAVPIIATTLLFILSSSVGFPFWGRHLTGVLPFVLAGGALALKAEARVLRVCLACALVCCYGFSSFQLRYASRHAKDDYRTAAGLAKTALGEQRRVWWSADTAAAAYYGLPLTKTAGNWSAARVLMNPSLVDVQDESLPDLALLSKPDVYDRNGALRRVLDAHGFRVTRELPAFSVLEKSHRAHADAAP